MHVVTWNMQGSTGSGENKWNTDVKRLFGQANVDVALLQEAGVPPASAPGAAPPAVFPAPPPFVWTYLQWNLGTISRPSIVFVFWVQCDVGGNRCNLAIAVRTAPLSLLYLAPAMRGGRPSIGVRVAYGPAALDVYTLHAFSDGGNDAPRTIAAIAAFSPAWAAAGDFNRNPATMPPPAAGVHLCNHNAIATHPGSGTNLDYGYKNFGGATAGIVDPNFVVSDHFPVHYTI